MTRIFSRIFLVLLASFAFATCDVVADSCLSSVNAKRVAVGLPPFLLDAQLQAWSQYKADLQAYHGRMGHLYRSSFPGRAEGVGSRMPFDSNGCNPIACSLYSRSFRSAGAAFAHGRNGVTYYCIIYR